MSYDRFLTTPGPNAEVYEILDSGEHVVACFTTDSVNGRTPDETAYGNLLDFSEYHDGEFTVRRLAGETFGKAQHGVGEGFDG